MVTDPASFPHLHQPSLVRYVRTTYSSHHTPFKARNRCSRDSTIPIELILQRRVGKERCYCLRWNMRHYTFVRSMEHCWRTVWVSWFSHNSPMKHASTWVIILTSKVPDIGPQIIKDLPLSIHSIQRLQCGVHYQASEYSVPCSSKEQSLLTYVFCEGS